MLKALIKVNLAAMLNWLTGGGKRSKNASNKKGEVKSGKGKVIGFALLMVYAFGVFAWLFAQVFGLMAEPLYMADCGWLYFVYAFILTFAIMFILSVFAAKNRLYEAKDNDLLLSLPIPPAYILGSRMFMLWGMNFLWGALVYAPAVYMWFKVAPFDAVSLVFIIVLFLGLCFFTLSLSALFGWLLSLLSARMKKKALFETVFSLVFLALYFYGYSKITDIISGLLSNNDAIAASMSAIMPLLWIGLGATGEALPFLLGLAVLLVPFIVVYVILSRTFIKTATAKRGSVKVRYEAKEQKESSPSSALLRREFGRFFSSSTCITNNGLGAVFLIVGAVALLINKARILELLSLDPLIAQYAIGAVIVMVTLLAGMVQPTSSSVSLEGKSIWIVQSMPVSPAAALLAKLRLSLILYVPPVLLCMAAAIYVLRPSAELVALSVLVPAAALVVMAQIGLIANVNHPSLDWVSETQAVKNGVAVLFAMLIDFGIAAAMGLGGYFLLSAGVSLEMTLTAYLVILLVAARLLYSHIVSRSAQKFAQL